MPIRPRLTGLRASAGPRHPHVGGCPQERLGAVLLLGLALTAFLWSLSAPSALAGKSVDRVVAGGLTAGSVQGAFNTPRGVAVNDPGIADGTTDPLGASTNGYVYVADSSNHRIQVFDAAGNFKFMWGRGVQAGGDGAQICDSSEIPCLGGTTDDEEGEFNTPQGIGINQQTGDVYVRDRTNLRVQQFTANGTFVRAWGWDVASAASPDNTGTAFESCTSLCKIGLGGANGGQFANPSGAAGNATGIAVDPSAPNDVFVADPQNRRVQQFAANGSFVRLWGWDVVAGGTPGVPVENLGTNNFEICPSTAVGVCKAGANSTPLNQDGAFATANPLHIAVDGPSGVVFASDTAGLPSPNRVVRFDSDETTPADLLDPELEVGVLTGTSQTGTNGLAVNPVNGNLFIARSAAIGVLELGNAGAAVTPTHVDTHYVGSGLTPTSIGLNAGTADLFMTSNTPAGHRLFAADDNGAPPAEAAVLPASDVSATTATVRAEIGSSGALSSTYRLEVSRNGNDWTTVTTGQVAAGGTVTASGSATGLLPNTLYRVRAVTQRQFGNPDIPSAELTFLTDAAPPEIRTTSVQSVSGSAATVSARINPHSTQTSYHVEWGQGSFNRIAPIPDAPVGGGAQFVLVSEQLTGLQPGAIYQFRFVANSVSEGTTTGPTGTFTATEGADKGLSPDDRAYELVSPPDKLGGQGVGIWYSGPSSLGESGMPSYNGERFANVGERGGVLLNGAYTYATDWAFAERASSTLGWVNHSPITHPASNSQFYKYLRMGKATDDLSRIVWAAGSGALLRPFPEMASWPDSFSPRFIGDWSGRWEIFGPTAYDLALAPNGSATYPEFSADGSTVAGGVVGIRGLAGAGDPTLDPSYAGTFLQSVYRGDASNSPADTLGGAGERELVNVCADGTEIPAVDGAGDVVPGQCAEGQLISPKGAALQDNITASAGPRSASERTISRDGSRVFFMSPDPAAPANLGPVSGITGMAPAFCVQTGDACPPQLYVSVRAEDGSMSTRWISHSRSQAAPGGGYGGPMITGQDASLTGRVIFEGASEDGDKVLFRTNSPLTPDDPNGGAQVPGGVTTGSANSNSWDLYLYDLPDDPDMDAGDGTLTRISAGPTGSGDGNGFQEPPGDNDLVAAQGMMRFTSDDASRIYFTVSGTLPGVSPPSNGSIIGPGGTPQTSDQTNLYLYDATQSEPSERWRYIARLPRAVTGVNACASTGIIPGTTLTLSEPSAGDPDNALPLIGGSGRRNCFRGKSDGTFVTFWTAGRLTNDDPDTVTGDVYAYDATRDEIIRITAPQGGVGGSYKCIQGSVGIVNCHGDAGLDKNDTVSPAKPMLGVATDPEIEGDQIAFFQSRSRLVPEDTDTNYDVYQWRNGKLSLISRGTSPTDGFSYRGNNESGSSVYIATRDRLTWQDVDSVADNYVARVGGGVPQPPAPVICSVLAGGCQGTDSHVTPVAPVSGGPSDGNTTPGARVTLGVPRVSAKARRAAVRNGTLAVRVQASAASRVTVIVRGRVGKRRKIVGQASARLSAARATTVRIRLSAEARRKLRRTGKLALDVTVQGSDARARTTTTVLRRAGK